MGGADGHQFGQVLAAIQELRGRFDSVEQEVHGLRGRLDSVEQELRSRLDSVKQELGGRLDAVEEIILARLNDTRPFDHQLMARLDQMSADFNKFREETNGDFQLVNEKLEFPNNNFLDTRARHNLLEKRVARLEEHAA